MEIDITPIIEKANDLQAICLKMRNIEALYVARLANGTNYTVEFDKQTLDVFQPNKTVSEMLTAWEEGIQRRYDTAVVALKTKKHPYLTVEREEMQEITGVGGIVREFPTGKTISEPKKLDRYEKAYFKLEKAERKLEFGKINFIKIC